MDEEKPVEKKLSMEDKFAAQRERKAKEAEAKLLDSKAKQTAAEARLIEAKSKLLAQETKAFQVRQKIDEAATATLQKTIAAMEKLKQKEEKAAEKEVKEAGPTKAVPLSGFAKFDKIAKSFSTPIQSPVDNKVTVTKDPIKMLLDDWFAEYLKNRELDQEDTYERHDQMMEALLGIQTSTEENGKKKEEEKKPTGWLDKLSPLLGGLVGGGMAGLMLKIKAIISKVKAFGTTFLNFGKAIGRFLGPIGLIITILSGMDFAADILRPIRRITDDFKNGDWMDGIIGAVALIPNLIVNSLMRGIGDFAGMIGEAFNIDWLKDLDGALHSIASVFDYAEIPNILGQFFSGMWDMITVVFSLDNIWEFIKEYNPYTLMYKFYKGVYDYIAGMFDWGKIWNGIKEYNGITLIYKFYKRMYDYVTGLFDFKAISNFIDEFNPVESMQQFFVGVFDYVTGIFSSATDSFKQMMSGITDWTLELPSKIAEWFGIGKDFKPFGVNQPVSQSKTKPIEPASPPKQANQLKANQEAVVAAKSESKAAMNVNTVNQVSQARTTHTASMVSRPYPRMYEPVYGRTVERNTSGVGGYLMV